MAKVYWGLQYTLASNFEAKVNSSLQYTLALTYTTQIKDFQAFGVGHSKSSKVFTSHNISFDNSYTL